MPLPRTFGKRITSLQTEGVQFFFGTFPVLPNPVLESTLSLFFYGNPNEVLEDDWDGPPFLIPDLLTWNGAAVYIYLPQVTGGLPGRFHTVSVWRSLTGFSPFIEYDYETCGTQQPFCKQFYLPTAGLGARILVKLDCENFTANLLEQEYCVALREYWPTYRTPDPFGP